MGDMADDAFDEMFDQMLHGDDYNDPASDEEILEVMAWKRWDDEFKSGRLAESGLLRSPAKGVKVKLP